MDWRQLADGLRQLIAKVASPRRAAQEIDSQAGRSVLAALSGGEGYDEAQISPYIPDDHSARNDDSLHLSC
jgi:hypothetical protein